MQHISILRGSSKVCPSKALDKDGPFKKMDCLGYLVKHAIYPLALKTEKGLQQIERVINTAGYNYWLTCNECLRVCPSKRPKKPSKAELERTPPRWEPASEQGGE